ncbi:hypothetical protein ACQF4J_22235 [Streptomyces sp. C1-1]|uniref:hypothetical protein n=1 Tax=Streptomyces sp. C1-1 TaxID=3231173 RepID=UPI003D0134E3
MNRDAQGPDSRDRHEPFAWHEPTAPHEQEHTQSHAGNGTVNHGPDDQSPDGFDSDELALRRMLHQAVQTVEPRDGTLEHLRRAVPARRARKRQAMVGMAAAALFLGTAVPALVHVSNSTGSDVNPSVAGQASQAQGGANQGKTNGSESTAGGTSGKSGNAGKNGTKGDGKGKNSGAATGGTAGTDPSATSATAPVCTAGQLGQATGSAAAPDAAGTVYGTFRVVNVSSTSCTVDALGSVGFQTAGAADSTKISTMRHVSGDAAAGLPDPSTELASLILQPGAAYEVKFAWVPSQSCPSTGGDSGGTTDGGPTADPSPTGDTTSSTTGTTSTGTDSGVTTQMLRTDGTADGSVIVSHTTQAGSPTATATVPNACAGIVYYTGLLAGS